MATTTFQVTGMTCAHCEASVREEVTKIEAVDNVEVSAATGILTIEAIAPLDDTAVFAAVDEAGYTAARSS